MMQKITLQESYGFTGCRHMGFLVDAAGSATRCVPGRRAARRWYTVKGPWMLCFGSDSPKATVIGLPIPLDGATVHPVGENEFEIYNEHTKTDFYGKSAIYRVQGFEAATFENVVLKNFAAPSSRSRDQWVDVLRSQISTLKSLPRTGIFTDTYYGRMSYGSAEVSVANHSITFALFAEFEEARKISKNLERMPARADDIVL